MVANQSYFQTDIYKKIIFSAFLFTYFVVAASGQMSLNDIKSGEYGTPETRTLQIDTMMQKGLELTPEQLPVIHAINFHYSKRVENEVVKQDMGDWARYRLIMKIQKEKDKELKEILTKEQFEKYAEKRDEMFWEGVKSFLF